MSKVKGLDISSESQLRSYLLYGNYIIVLGENEEDTKTMVSWLMDVARQQGDWRLVEGIDREVGYDEVRTFINEGTKFIATYHREGVNPEDLTDFKIKNERDHKKVENEEGDGWGIFEGDVYIQMGKGGNFKGMRYESKLNEKKKIENRFDKSLTEEDKGKLQRLINEGKNIMVYGELGKTEFAGWMLDNIRKEKKVCVVESYREMELNYNGDGEPNWVNQVLGIGYTQDEVFLGSDYDWLVYDEVRGTTNFEEVKDKALKGVRVISTMHGRSIEYALNILKGYSIGIENLKSEECIKEDILGTFDVIVGLKTSEYEGLRTIGVDIHENIKEIYEELF